jgi:hypothetical protein
MAQKAQRKLSSRKSGAPEIQQLISDVIRMDYNGATVPLIELYTGLCQTSGQPHEVPNAANDGIRNSLNHFGRALVSLDREEALRNILNSQRHLVSVHILLLVLCATFVRDDLEQIRSRGTDSSEIDSRIAAADLLRQEAISILRNCDLQFNRANDPKFEQAVIQLEKALMTYIAIYLFLMSP